jgi:hypothetical protein
MKGQNLGHGATILRKYLDSEHERLADLNNYAPGEYFADFFNDTGRRFRTTRRQIKATTGLKYPAFLRELRSRTSAAWVLKNLVGEA